MKRSKQVVERQSVADFTARPRYMKELAAWLGENPRTTSKRIQAMGISLKEREWGKKFSPKQLEYILKQGGITD
jgi:heterodisulfide reductase subunit B